VDFFRAQDSARTRSRTLGALFALAVAAIVVSIYAVVRIATGYAEQGANATGSAFFDPALFSIVAVVTVGIITAASAYRTSELRRGGSVVAELLGGRRVHPSTSDDAERRLVNVVEEMSIASGTPVPAIYLLDSEMGINAFAAGHTPDDAAVAVTRGALDRLTRDELQGVMAHEFSHILNGDMRLNIRLIGLLFGIRVLAIVGRGLLRVTRGGGRRGKKDGGGQVALIGLGLLVVGYVGVLFGRLIQGRSHGSASSSPTHRRFSSRGTPRGWGARCGRSARLPARSSGRIMPRRRATCSLPTACHQRRCLSSRRIPISRSGSAGWARYTPVGSRPRQRRRRATACRRTPGTRHTPPAR
jgi:Zn-dependent protease with chaperone function